MPATFRSPTHTLRWAATERVKSKQGTAAKALVVKSSFAYNHSIGFGTKKKSSSKDSKGSKEDADDDEVMQEVFTVAADGDGDGEGDGDDGGVALRLDLVVPAMPVAAFLMCCGFSEQPPDVEPLLEQVHASELAPPTLSDNADLVKAATAPFPSRKLVRSFATPKSIWLQASKLVSRVDFDNNLRIRMPDIVTILQFPDLTNLTAHFNIAAPDIKNVELS